MRWKTIFAILLIVIIPMGCSVQISEIMYDPVGSDGGNEWIEFYNNDTETNITIWRLDIGGNHTLNAPPANGGNGSMIIPFGDYFIITQDAAAFFNSYNFSGTVIDSSWGDMPNSANKTIIIRSISEIFDNVTYFPIAAEGNSTCLVNGSFMECIPTPGAVNIWTQPTDPINQSQVNESSTCDIFPEVKTDYIVYNVSTITFEVFLNDTTCTAKNVTLTYDVEDIFGGVVKQPIITTEEFTCSRTITRQWTPPGMQGTEVYEIKASVLPQECNGTPRSASKLIVVSGTPPQDTSSIVIDGVNLGSDSKIKYGEAGEVSLTIYRGNTAKTSVDIYVTDANGKKLSETTNINLNGKFLEYSINVPLRMKTNCDHTLTDGLHTLVVEGLDGQANSTLRAEGVSDETCRTVTQTVLVSSGGGGSGGISPTSTSATKEIAEIYFNHTLYVGDETTVTVNVSNRLPYPKTYAIYSYIFRGQNPVSQGYDERAGEWRGTYMANEKNLTLGANKAVQISMRNKVEDGTEPGEYNLRVRIKSGTETNDITKTVTILKKTVTPLTQPVTVKEPASNETTNEPKSQEKWAAPVATGLQTAKPRHPNYFQIILSPLGRLVQLLAP